MLRQPTLPSVLPRCARMPRSTASDGRRGRGLSRSVRLVLAAAALALLAGCAGLVDVPEHARPETPEKTTWSRPNVSAADTIAPDWWRAFGDPYLEQLVDRAIAGNFDVKILAARIQVAKAQIAEARAGALPTLDIGAGASFEKSTGQKFSKTFNLGTQVNWELDVWGKVEKGVQAQTAEFRASEADWRAGYLALVSDVSSTYFQILQLDEQVDRQQRALERNRLILDTYTAMLGQGLIPKTQVLRQGAENNRLTNDLIELRRARELAGNALATLLGVAAGEFTVPPGHLQDRVKLPVVPAGLPSGLLARRPDIVAAEFRVLSAYDLVGQAKLAQLPSISLTGRAGTSSFALGDLLKSFTFGFLPSINIPAFDPSIKARLKTSEAQTKVFEHEYQRTVIGAFEEVENALTNLDAHKQQRVELQQQIEQLEVVAEQIAAQVREGVVSQLEVFESERSLLSAQLALLANHQQILADTVTLYKALGGGWPAVEVANAPREPQSAQ
ncbi:MAG: efflux transporter outer membrane subunit [Aromatoleum sp.]|jgi:NodT family efflux transporter outer membrane factor (OMF) lipoprotein|uniref:efflux transporter outer membrane subunit n=1 Tax=Aromatoleum sp. TaxID=2307007 RepID=UPI0028944A74|nr:efflux transporter outer membrane subunit [Aromatoleum sp.]MDT3671455.1 efflux transporter outer membrane subunit [Aromatoleum sp.]